MALLLGLRHASDPDHLAAVSTLIASDPEDGTRRAGRLGLAWGAGHALTLALFGLPIVLLQAYLPERAPARAPRPRSGVMIMLLALRLLIRWRRGHFHAHPHRHGDVGAPPPPPARRSTPVAHAHDGARPRAHDPDARLGRTRWQAFGIGLVHGMGGSAGVSVLLLAGDPRTGPRRWPRWWCSPPAPPCRWRLLSSAFGYAITRGPVLTRMLALAPAMGMLTLAFGGWYTLGAIGAVPYVL